MATSDALEEFAFTFRCRCSGNCCSRPGGIVRVDEAELLDVAEHLGLSPAGVRSRFLDAGGKLKSGPGERFVMLEHGAAMACTIYPARPAKCRSWPYWPELRDSPVVAGAARLCP